MKPIAFLYVLAGLAWLTLAQREAQPAVGAFDVGLAIAFLAVALVKFFPEITTWRGR